MIGLTGEKLLAREIPTNQKSFEEVFSSYPSGEILVAVEISSLTFWLCDVLQHQGLLVYVVNTLENHYLSHSVKKTDKEDARKLAIQVWKEILPAPVYIPRKEERDLRRLVSQRHCLVKSLTRVINRTSHLLANYEIKFSRRALTSPKRWQQLRESFEAGQNPVNRAKEGDRDMTGMAVDVVDADTKRGQAPKGLYRDRYQLIGKTDGGRRLKIIFQIKPGNVVRLITGWPI